MPDKQSHLQKLGQLEMKIDEKSLNKGQLRKLGALRISLGDKIADKAFAEWLKEQAAAKPTKVADPVAEKIAAALMPLEDDKSITLGRYGYSIKRSKGRSAKGFAITRIEKA